MAMIQNQVAGAAERVMRERLMNMHNQLGGKWATLFHFGAARREAGEAAQEAQKQLRGFQLDIIDIATKLQKGDVNVKQASAALKQAAHGEGPSGGGERRQWAIRFADTVRRVEATYRHAMDGIAAKFA